MIFKNTFKLILPNFSLTYKVFIYKIIILLLALSVAGTIGAPFIMHLVDIDFLGFLTTKLTFLIENLNLGNVFFTLKEIFLNIIDVFKGLDSTLLINVILAISVFVLIYGLIGSACELATIDCLNSNLSSKTKLSFFKSLVAKSLKSFGKTIIQFILSVPFYAILILVVYFGFSLYDNSLGVLKFIIPAIMFLAFIIVKGCHLTIFAGFSPSIIIKDEGLFKDLKTGLKLTSKKFFVVLSTSLMISFIVVLGNVFIAVYSFFAGLIFTLPITYLIISLFKIISFYEINGMRYYCGDNIRTPLKKSEQDKIKKIKNII